MAGMTDEGTSKHPPIGPVGDRVIANVEELRQARRLSFRDLAARLAELDRPIGSAVLHRLSQGRRRVDADDLVALAIALDVNPNALLLDRHAKPGDVLSLTPAYRQRADVTWQWAEGGGPLPDHLLGEGEPFRRTLAKEADFAANAQPDLAARRRHPAVLAAGQLIGVFLGALLDRDEETGEWKDEETRERRREEVSRALQRLALEIDDEFAGPVQSAQAALTVTPSFTADATKRKQGEEGADGRLRPMALEPPAGGREEVQRAPQGA